MRRHFKSQTKKCGTCGKFKLLEEFHNRAQNKDGRRSSCKPCEQEAYNRWRENNKNVPPIFVGSKVCKSCGKSKDRSQYTFNAASRDHLKSICSECSTNTHGEWARRSASKSVLRRHYLMRLHGITEEIFDRMREEQNNKCAICRKEFTETPYVDHCHDTGKVRGLLCRVCNTLLAGIERKGFLEMAVRYLHFHHPWNHKYYIGDFSQ